ncbi:MAG: hypothetical protein PHI05_03295 [Bacilli bacterium]|nr:hypothetical protein [Bacilli bacterium]MDD4547747.1 hypothetical protein [Bacilli bacterium]
MFKTEIEFSKNTLYINILGNVNRDSLLKLRQKMYYIIDEYNVFDIVINVKNSEYVDMDAFYNFLDEYDIKYGGNLIVVDSN